MSFTYAKIPADPSEAVQELTASKAGGLEQDELLAAAKAYFHQQVQTNPEEKPSCEIIALSVPVPGNEYQTVSLYASDYGHDSRENTRATQLVTACGHSFQQPIRGDVFVGRAYDNDAFEWERMDFTADDADATTAEWCKLARKKGGGGGQGGSTASASSLSGLLKQQLGAAGATVQGTGPVQQQQPSSSLYGMNGAPPVSEPWGSWTQTTDEVELKLSVPLETKSKDCKIGFKRNQLSVAVKGEQIPIEGSLFGEVVPDECTYTLENVTGDRRELCITLTKAEEGKTWSWLTLQ